MNRIRAFCTSMQSPFPWILGSQKNIETIMRHGLALLWFGALCTQLASCGWDGGSSSTSSTQTNPAEVNFVPSENTVALQPGCDSQPGATLALTPSVVPQACQVDSWLAGSTAICKGRLIYRDYLYDDHGADTGGLVADSASPAGDKTYPAGAENTADLVQLQLWTHNNRLYIRGELNTLLQAGQAQLAVAIDTDNNPRTGGGQWCSLPVSSNGWDVLQVFRQGDVQSNVIEGSMPMPQGNTWRIQAVVAQQDGTVMNVAYRGINEQSACKTNTTGGGCFFEDKQAAALAKGNISEFGQVVSVADLRPSVNQPATVITPGLHSWVYQSKFSLGEGLGSIAGRGDGALVPVAAQKFVFLGKYQPYGIYVPTPKTDLYPLQMVFHGSGNVHSSLISQPGMQRAFGDQFGRLLVAPLARGADGYGSDISERDLLDVMSDVQKNFRIDPSRTIASGYSQGGYITYRMAMLYPDKFAGFVNWVGFTGDVVNGLLDGDPIHATAGAVGNVRDFVGNLRNVPGVMVVAGADELVHATSTYNMQQTFASTDNRYKWYMHPVADHAIFATLDQWDKEAADSANWTLETNPVRVTFRHDPTLGNVEYGIAHDRAYWVSNIQNRVVGKSQLNKVYGDVDILNRACGGSVAVSEKRNNTGTGPLPWFSLERVQLGQQAVMADKSIEGTLKNIASLTLDVEKTCLKGVPVKYTLSTDGPANVLLSDGRQLVLPAAGNFSGVLN